MASPNNLVEEGINAFKSGDKAKAQQLLAQAVQQDKNNEQAWYYLAAAQTNIQRRKECLEMVLKINPANGKAREMLDRVNARLSEEKTDEAPPPPPSEPEKPKREPSASGSGFKLPVEIPGAPERVTWRELLDDGIALLRNSVGIFLKHTGAYEDEIQRATWWRFWLTVGTGSVVSAIFFALGSLFLEFRVSSMTAGFYSPNILTPILTLIFSILINMAAVYAGCYASHWYATKQAHGIASLVQHSHAMAAAWLPGSVVSAALGALITLLFGATASINLLFSAGGLAVFGFGLILALIVSIGIALYILSIQVKGVQVLYKFTGQPMWFTVLIMLVVTGIVYSLLNGVLPGY